MSYYDDKPNLKAKLLDHNGVNDNDSFHEEQV